MCTECISASNRTRYKDINRIFGGCLKWSFSTIYRETVLRTAEFRRLMLIPLKLLPRRWNDAGYLILLWKERKRKKKKNYTFIQSRYLDACSFLRAIMLQLRGDWFYNCRYKTGKIYGYLDTGVTIARDILPTRTYQRSFSSSHFSVASSTFCNDLFFLFSCVIRLRD